MKKAFLIVLAIIVLIGGVYAVKSIWYYNSVQESEEGKSNVPIEIIEEEDVDGLIKIETSVKNDSPPSNIKVKFHNGESVPATYIKGDLYYIGKPESEENTIDSIVYSVVEEVIITKDSLEPTGTESYTYKYPEKGINLISMNAENGGFIPTTLEGEFYVMEISKEIFESSEVFTLTVSKEIDLAY